MIRKVAVIGGGPAGIVTVYNSIKANEKSDFPIECIGFEAKGKLGGVWSDTPGESFEDYPTTFQRLASLNDEKFATSDRDLFYSKSPLVAPNGHTINLKGLSDTSHSRPLKLARESDLPRDGLFFTTKTGLYDNFFGNVPDELMRFEDTSVHDPQYDAQNSSLSPLIDLARIQQHLHRFINQNKLKNSFRLYTSVEYVDKLGADSWIIVAKRSLPENNHDEWYLERFDAVVICTGHFQMPYVPFYMSRPNEKSTSGTGIHQYNCKFPGNLVHVRDIDSWNHRTLPHFKEKAKYKRILIVGKSFSCMDVLKKIINLRDSVGLEIVISTDIPPSPENKQNPFYWFDVWLSQTDKVILKPQISKFMSDTPSPTVQFVDGTELQGIDNIIFATGYLFSFPFLSSALLDNCKVLITPDPRNLDGMPSNTSRITGLYLHTFSIAEPTLAFCGVSSNANFQSFHISAKAIIGAFTKFNKLSYEQKPQDYPYYDSIWRQILPPIDKQLEWSRNRLSQTGNNGSFHFYYPLPSLLKDWLQPCSLLFPEGDNAAKLFPTDSQQLSIKGIEKLRDIFLEVME